MYSENKKGQVTLFVILAVVIVASILGIYVLKQQGFFSPYHVNSDVKPVYDFVRGCIEKTSNRAIYSIGLGGGYYLGENLSSLEITSYTLNGRSYAPSRAEIEEEIAKTIPTLFSECINKFNNFKEFDMINGSLKINVSINEENVIVGSEYPIAIKRAGSVYQISNYEPVSIPIRLGLIYNYSMEIVDTYLKTGGFGLIYLSENSTNLGFYFVDYQNYTLVDISEPIKNKNSSYEFMFALQ